LTKGVFPRTISDRHSLLRRAAPIPAAALALLLALLALLLWGPPRLRERGGVQTTAAAAGPSPPSTVRLSLSKIESLLVSPPAQKRKRESIFGQHRCRW